MWPGDKHIDLPGGKLIFNVGKLIFQVPPGNHEPQSYRQHSNQGRDVLSAATQPQGKAI